MTIHQLKDLCWELRPALDDERQPHYDTEAAALADLGDARDEADDAGAHPDTKAVRLDAPCWVVQCDGECEMILDTEDEGYTYHHGTLGEAMETVGAYSWKYAGERVFCEEDAPGDSRALPSPAELEAAGQMRLPGVA